MKCLKLILATVLLLCTLSAHAGSVVLWEKVFEVDAYGTVLSGSSSALAAALKQGADLRVIINENNIDYSFVPTKYSVDLNNSVVAWFSELDLNGSAVIHRLQKFNSSGLLQVYYLESPGSNFAVTRHMTWLVKR